MKFGRKFLLPLFVILGVSFFFISSLQASQTPNNTNAEKPVITSALVDQFAGQASIDINGHFLHQNGISQVLLGSNNPNTQGPLTELTVLFFEPGGTQLIVALPAGVIDGTHLLTVITSRGFDEFYVSVESPSNSTEVLWADVGRDGSLLAGNGVVSLNKETFFSSIRYSIEFNRDISLCAVTYSSENAIRSQGVSHSGSTVILSTPFTSGINFGVAVHCGGSSLNLPPTTGTVSLSPAGGDVTALDTLTCSVTGSVDSDGNPVAQHNFAFVRSTGFFFAPVERSGTTSATIQVNEGLRPGSIVRCEAETRVDAPTMFGESVSSAEQVTVVNTPPTMGPTGIASSSFGGVLFVICLRGAITDPDFGDFAQVSSTSGYKWYKDEAGVIIPGATGEFLAATEFGLGGIASCEAQATDQFLGVSGFIRSINLALP